MTSPKSKGPVLLTKPAIPRNIRRHALFGLFVKRHQFMTPKWTPSSLTKQFKSMVEVLSKKVEYEAYQKAAEAEKNKKRFVDVQKLLKEDRKNLSIEIVGNTDAIQQRLTGHREMKRLYKRMPPHVVVENIDHKTFKERKERDRLAYHKTLVAKEFEDKLYVLSLIEDQVRFPNEFVPKEEIIAKEYQRRIRDSETRLQAAITIGRTYRKVLKVLRQDAIYYNPVLDDLLKDIDEQSNFILQVIDYGLPAISNLRKLTEEYRKIEEDTRKQMQTAVKMVTDIRIVLDEDKASLKKALNRDETPTEIREYIRETPSMTELRVSYEAIRSVIRRVKTETLATSALKIYPLLQQQVARNELFVEESNVKNEEINKILGKTNRAALMKNKIHLNKSVAEAERARLIETLQQDIQKKKKEKEENIAGMKNEAEMFVQLRFSLIQLAEVLRHVGDSEGSIPFIYPDKDLKLPFLKFDFYTSLAVPPSLKEFDAKKVLGMVRKKVDILMHAYHTISKASLEADKDKYHQAYLQSLEEGMALTDTNEGKEKDAIIEVEEGRDPNVPTASVLKAVSANIVETAMKKKEDQI